MKNTLNVKYKKIDIDKGCALNSVAMVFDYYKKKFDPSEFVKTISCRDRGYDLSEIAEELIKTGENVEFGFWDDEMIGKSNAKKTE